VTARPRQDHPNLIRELAGAPAVDPNVDHFCAPRKVAARVLTVTRFDHPAHGEAVRRACALAIAAMAAIVALAMAPAESRAAACDPPVTNPVACENTKPGTPQEDWTIDKSGDDSLQGFATQMSVNKGETINFKIKSTSTAAYHIDILRLGYYGGDGARKVASNLAPTGTSTQPACQT
jgi:hypothetical protein